jgi:DNA polymerase-3 subunit epsilon
MTFYELSGDAAVKQRAREIDAHADYKVLRRLPRLGEIWLTPTYRNEGTTIAIVDVETSGLVAGRDKMTELALVKLTLDRDGNVCDITEPLTMREDPKVPISPQITALTGITDAMVAGQRFDDQRIADALDDVQLIVAHNVKFDAAFLRVRFPFLSHPWGCSMREVDWSAADLEGRALGHLLSSAGMFMDDAHRAGTDAWALACLLAATARDGRAFAAELIDRARAATYRVSAVNAPYATKDRLRDRGFRWNADAKAWQIDVDDREAVARECAAVSALHPCIDPQVADIDWYSRHVV